MKLEKSFRRHGISFTAIVRTASNYEHLRVQRVEKIEYEIWVGCKFCRACEMTSEASEVSEIVERLTQEVLTKARAIQSDLPGFAKKLVHSGFTVSEMTTEFHFQI